MTKFRVIVKVGSDRFLKYRNVTNLDKFRSFLDLKYPAWRWCNVYDRNGDQVDSFTNRSE